MISDIDILIRRLLSGSFRILIVVYSLTVLFRFENEFEWYYYTLGLVIYSTIYILCYGKDGKWGIVSILRLLNDFALFYLVLYGKPIIEPHTLIFVLLPIVNSLNHSGEKRSFLRTLFMYLCTLGLIFTLNNFSVPISVLVIIGTLAVINIFLSIRVSILNYVDRLNNTFENFTMSYAKERKHHLMLEELIEKFEDIPLVLRPILFKPEKLVCYRQIKGEFAIKSSSPFILKSEIEDVKGIIAELNQNEAVFNKTVHLNEQESKYNAFVKVVVGSSAYIFLFTFSEDSDNKLNRLFVKRFIKTALMKIARIIDYENKIKGERRKILDQYKSKFKTLEDTRDTLHYVKNKLGPVHTYFDLLSRQEKKGTDYSGPMEKAMARIPSNLANIKKKSMPFLNNQYTPYDADLISEISVKKLFSVIIDSFQDEIDSEYSLDIKSVEGLNGKVLINVDMLEFLIGEIAMNIDEHSVEGLVSLEFSFLPEEMTLVITNKVNKVKNADKIMKLFNKDHVTLSLETRYNGLTLLKRNLIKLGIGNKINIYDDEFSLILNFEYHDGSNI